MRTTFSLLFSLLLAVSSLSAQPACQISGLTATVTNCVNGLFSVQLNFDHAGPASNGFKVQGNGTNYGVFQYSQVPLTLGPLAANGTTNYEFVVMDVSSTTPCQASTQLGPVTCNGQAVCEIFNLTLQTGDCNVGESTYSATIDFDVVNPTANNFKVWGNGMPLGVFPLTSLPLTVNNFPYNGGPNDVVKVCIVENTDCCRELEFPVPTCFQTGPCEISNLTIQTGDCQTNTGNYTATIDFEVANAPTGNFTLWANGTNLGSFPLSGLPLTINNFPSNGTTIDLVKVCINDAPNCCRTKEFQGPNCTQVSPCEISNLTVQTGDCHPDSTYAVTIDFDVANSPNALFEVWGNNVYLGNFPLTSLPLTIANFPFNGGVNDVLKVCINDAPNCCKIKEFPAPACTQGGGACEIYDLTIQTGDCQTNTGNYTATIDFEVANAPTGNFTLWANGTNLGSFPLSGLPLTVNNFPSNGTTIDLVKVCINDAPNCCRTKEFQGPNCGQTSACEISNLTVQTGDCHPDSTYAVTIDFDVANSPNALFDVWGNNIYLGNFPLTSLPLTIANFPFNGGVNDVLKVCINDAPNCCKIKEFPAPDCTQGGGACEIYDLTVQTGACNVADSTYTVVIDFEVANTTNGLFDVWGNGVYLGNFPLSSLPVTIANFPYNGGVNDLLKICINDNANCCKLKEFAVPACFQNGGACEIYDLTIQTGECHLDASTYTVVIDFEVANPDANTFGVWANNGVYLGTFPLSSLPLTIQNFPYNGGLNDVVKVCISESPNCCRVKEFPAPECYTATECHIWDVQVAHTPCLCGQFFALVTFNHANGSGGFDIVGNGTNYGTWPYSTSQPIILGPLTAGTAYEFNVRDHEDHDCHQGVEMGAFNCLTSTGGDGLNAPRPPALTLSPNPAHDYLSATTLWPGQSNLGTATVEIRQADGRLVRTLTVAEGSQFSLDTSNLAAGTYSVSVQTAVGRVVGSFVKL